MSETHELDKARAEYKKFLRLFDACPITCLGQNDRDINVKKVRHVDWTVALKRFLAERPSYKRFRDDLSEVRRDESPFLFDEESWNKACEL